jgi:hypothetical protein
MEWVGEGWAIAKLSTIGTLAPIEASLGINWDLMTNANK